MQNSNTSPTYSQAPTPSRVNWRVNDFCEAHGIGRTTFYDEVKSGQLKVIKFGKRTLIPDTEARAWQARRLACSA